MNIYFYHMMKTGGRSILSSILHLSHNVDHDNKSCSEKNCSYPEYCLLYQEFCKDLVMLIRTKDHVFRSSHTPYLFKNGLTLTSIREPMERLLSHYRMLIKIKGRGGGSDSDNPIWLGENLEYFMENFPIEFKLHQLYFYSKIGDPTEAFENIKKNTQIILTEHQQDGFDKFYEKSGIKLKEVKCWSRASTKDVDFIPSDDQVQLLKYYLKDEYTFYNNVIDYLEE